MQKDDRTTLLYILGTGSRWEDNELRYSLRSVEKHIGDVRVVICGEKPKWIKNIVHIPAKDVEENKLNNAIHKIGAALKSGKVSSNFILMNDDFFFLQPHNEISIFHLGKMTDAVKNHKTHAGYYYEAIKKTMILMITEGIEQPKNYEVHYPFPMDTKLTLDMMQRFAKSKPYLFRSVYGNVFHVNGTKRKDTKIYKVKALLEGFADNLDLISTHDPVVLRPRMRQWLSEQLPDVSQYETDNGHGVEAWEQSHKQGPRFAVHSTFAWRGKQYNPGDIIRDNIPANIVRRNGMTDLNDE